MVKKRTVVHAARQLPIDRIDEWFHIAFGHELD